MARKLTNHRYLDLLKQRTVVFDGAMGTNLQQQNLTVADFGGEQTNGCNDFLVISCPRAVESVHRSFLEVGVDVIETDTFRSNRITLSEYGLQARVTEINRTAAALARRLADEYSRQGHGRLVAGSMGPSGKLPSMDDPELSNVSFDELADVFREQARGLIEGGVDLLLIETSQDILEVKAAILGIQQAFSETGIFLPIQAQVTLDTTGRMLLGTDITAVLAILEGMPIDVIGLNCSTGPDHMRESIRYLGENSPIPVSCIPNAGLPLNVDGKAVYPLKPLPFASALAEFVNSFHVSVVGGCCGTTPEHLRLLVDLVGNKHPHPRPTYSFPRLASATQAVPMRQEPPPFLIGERLNTQGSQKFKKMMLAEDFEGALELARQQMDSGAHGLDLCTALTERSDEADLMRRLVKKLAPAIRLPLVIDTTEPEVMEVALQNAPGRCLLNSINLEAGRAKADRVLSLAKKYNAAVIALTIDEQGMAKTSQRKLEIARRIYQLAVDEHSMRPEDLVFDALTFTLATGDPEFSRSAIETIEGIRLIKKELPGVLTSLGVSNVSFGLTSAARAVINSVMLYHCVQAGLDMAIVNPAQITPYPEISTEEKELAEDLLFNRREDALQRLIEFFNRSSQKQSARPDEKKNQLASMTPEERIAWRILHRQKEGIEADIDTLIHSAREKTSHEAAVEVLNRVLLPAMKEVGDRFGAGELILPFVLQSAEVMKKAVNHLETYLDRKEGVSKGTLVLATVYGDVHDIGKNLVKTILSNNGYQVIDLGKQVPAETIISKAIEVQADAIGLSALLVSTSKQMPLIVNELYRRKLSFPVLIGGAAINRHFGRRILLTEAGEFYSPGVFYCKDAFEGLETMDRLIDPDQRQPFLEQIRREAEKELERVSHRENEPSGPEVRSSIPPATFIPRPPAWGAFVVKEMPLESVFEHLSLNELFRLSWGAKNTHGDAWDQLEKEFLSRFERMKKEAMREGWLQPRGVYGYWPAQAEGNALILFDPEALSTGLRREIARFQFPRQPAGDLLCLADYFLPTSSDTMDVVALQVVTVGAEATVRFNQLQEAGNYSEAYFVHGLAVQTAEAAADYLHNHIRRELGLQPDQGKRYSWGYPAIPELSDHQIVFRLLPAEEQLGMSLTPAYQLVPEQSTAAIILHHPQAKYFSVGEARIDQLMKQD
ncbi:MAG TPA: methionine synthase [Anaerolinea thermolimosa]|uniref:Methionine synthase n=1 Tax=Anaerolinea thermolimosa TaxID=229919 RepID=A0A3D1JJQ9_9CHLR|nr:methionine synthase [Anaerolinea thermolimosa]GAP06300.1 methionine synthase [Anaerolinea thermolimosa]HCE17856.1 methionine synthase [Anaerolinea thermolimosa]